jgi:hypothetical protein
VAAGDIQIYLGNMGRNNRKISSLYLGLAFKERRNYRSARYHLNRAVGQLASKPALICSNWRRLIIACYPYGLRTWTDRQCFRRAGQGQGHCLTAPGFVQPVFARPAVGKLGRCHKGVDIRHYAVYSAATANFPGFSA